MRRAALLLPLVALGLALLFDVRQVQSDEMTPSIRAGDWVLLGPGRPSSGDVVRLQDPTEPDRAVLRRVIGLSGLTVTIQQGRIEVQGEALRSREMGRDDTQLVLSEANSWLVVVSPRIMRDPDFSMHVANAAAFVLADNRDMALDSRQWGAVPTDLLDGEVWLRFGPADQWRGAWSWGGRDGPWQPPSKQR